jgi:4-amino-4-deoxy-L-arabinose transferase-like glycosyltransferase
MSTATAPPGTAGIPPFAWRPVTAIAAGAAAFLLAIGGQYGYHRDELYFLEASKHLAWGYDDQPPLTPFLVRIETALFGDSVHAVRLFPMLFSVGLVFVAALSARELGGGRAAQVLAAAATAACPLVLVLGHLFVTANPDYLVWALILLLLLRWLRTRRDRLWPAIGALAGIGLLNNNLVGGLALVLIVSALIVGPRDLFGNRWVWLAALIAVVLWTPYLIWQASHGWPESKMVQHISSLQDERINLLPFQVEAGFLATPIWVAGWFRLARIPTYRMVAVAYPALLVLLLVTGGKRYYPGGFFPVLFGAGAVSAVDWVRSRTRGMWVTAAVVGTLLITVLLASPVFPAKTYASAGLLNLNKENGETMGWPRFAAQAADAYATIPAADRPRAVVLAENYGAAGALARFGPALGLPFAYAPHDGYRRFGTPADAQDGPVLVVGYHDDGPPTFLTGCVEQETVDNGLEAENEEQGWPMWVCSGPHPAWSALWPTLIHYS